MNKTRLTLILLMVLTLAVAPTKALAESKSNNFQEDLELELQQDRQELIDKAKRKRLIRRKYSRFEYEDLKKELEESDYEDKELQIEALDELIEKYKWDWVTVGAFFLISVIATRIVFKRD